MTIDIDSASFRDPSGFIFHHDDILYRQINDSYAPKYQTLMQSGLYDTLIQENLLISHQEVDASLGATKNASFVIRPSVVPFISYPYEWTFAQLKIAALTTLKIQKVAMKHGMMLKDSSAYNIQFVDGAAVLIDTLSFTEYRDGDVWPAYRQFCQHFLAPLALMSYRDIRLHRLFRTFIDGIPLDLAARLLPFRARLRLALLIHIFLHARVQSQYKDKQLSEKAKARKTNRRSLEGLIDNLEQGIRGLRWKPEGAWADYYDGDSYSLDAFEAKKALISEYLQEVKPQSVWDIGSNTGEFSRIASAMGIYTVSWDLDPAAVDLNFREVRNNQEPNLLPLVLDLANPSPSIGWALNERKSLLDRGKPDIVMALALVHHLAIGNNVPLVRIAEFFANLSSHLIIEFVPKEDKKVQILLTAREDIFSDYTEDGFVEAFQLYFDIVRRESIANSYRTVFLMKKK